MPGELSRYLNYGIMTAAGFTAQEISAGRQSYRIPALCGIFNLPLARSLNDYFIPPVRATRKSKCGAA